MNSWIASWSTYEVTFPVAKYNQVPPQINSSWKLDELYSALSETGRAPSSTKRPGLSVAKA